MDSLSSCGPHPNDQPPPPTAHAPNPTRVMFMSVVPSCRVENVVRMISSGVYAGRRKGSIVSAINVRGHLIEEVCQISFSGAATSLKESPRRHVGGGDGGKSNGRLRHHPPPAAEFSIDKRSTFLWGGRSCSKQRQRGHG